MVLPNGIYLIENNAATQVWTQPDNINLANFTLGLTYFTFHAKTASPGSSNDIAFEAFPGGFGFATPIGIFTEEFGLEGFLDNLDHRNQGMQFFSKHRKINQAKTYLIVKFDTAQFIKFADPDDNLRDYAPGYITGMSPGFDAGTRQHEFKATFQIVWGII